jgi:tetratricopeptide (TPR) repeat protein/predicted Ser/Thr protein kinase
MGRPGYVLNLIDQRGDMECPECNSPVEDDSRFCRVCGARLPRAAGSSDQATQPVVHAGGTLTAGSVFLGRYRIVKELGRGGMGVVYKAEDTKLRRNVALKFLPPEFTRDPASKQRFIHEAQAASALDHPAICRVHEIDETEDGRIFISMSCYEGTSLRERIEAGPLQVEEAVRIATQVAEGLEHAHERGIIHRDIKPGNIMLTARGQTTKIMDFGLAKLSGKTRITRAGAAMGTIAYMSPEQARGEEIDPRTDIWSLGVVLFEMLTGRLPFRGDYDQAVIYSILNEDPPPVGGLNPAVPAEVTAIVARCLRKAPRERYPSSTDLLADLVALGPVSSGARAGHRRAPSGQRRQTRFRPGKAGIAVGAVALAVLVIAAVPGFRRAFMGWVGWKPGGADVTRVALLPCEVEGGDPDERAFCDGLIWTLNSDLREITKSRGRIWVLPAGELDRPDLLNPMGISRALGIGVTIGSEMRRSKDVMEIVFTRNDMSVEPPGEASAEVLRRRRSRVLSDPLANLSTWQDSVLIQVAGLVALQVGAGEIEKIKSRSTMVPGAYEAFLKGVGYYRPSRGASDTDTAVRLFRTALEQDSVFVLARAWLGRAYLGKYLESGEAGWKDLALAAVRRAMAVDPEFVFPRWLEGEIYRASGRYAESLRIYDGALDLDPKDLWSHLSKGKAYRAMDSLDAAAREFRLAGASDPWYAGAYHYLGYVLFLEGRYEEAIEPFSRFVRLEPGNPDGFCNLGAIYFQVGRWDEARDTFEAALAIDTTASVCSNLGTIYFSEARYADAADMYARAMEASGGNYLVCGYLAECYFWIPGESEKATEYYRRAIVLAEKEMEQTPDDVSLVSSLASYYERVGDETGARELLARAGDLGSTDPMVLLRIAETYEQLGERDRALKWVASALDRLNPAVKLDGFRGLAPLRSDARYRKLLRDHGIGT